MDLWRMKPVQTAVQTVAVGSILFASYIGFRKFTDRTSPVSKIVEEVPEISVKIHTLEALDPDFVEIFGRLLAFRRFYPTGFDAMLDVSIEACKMRDLEYHKKLNAAASARVRIAFQDIIEKTRSFRAMIELKIESALEDFDDVAVDLNAKVEQVCQDSIQDTFTD